jgi:hypothetical protein
LLEIRSLTVKTRLLLTTAIFALLLSAQAHSAARLSPGLQTTSYAGMSWFLIAFELGPWDEYLLNELTPELENLTEHRNPRVSWLHFDEGLIIPDFAASLYRADRAPVVFSLLQQNVGVSLQGQSGGQLGDGMRFEQSLLVSGVTRQVSDRSALTVSAVLASQRFGASGMNLSETQDWQQPGSGLHAQVYGQPEVAHGTGVRLAMSSELLSNLSFEAAYQSRIEMAEFATLQGVHGSRAEFDIPSRIQLGMQFQATSRSSINLGVSQIYYSEVGAFPSRALPARFNALLGDSTSPQFSWEDLIVYSLGWRWQPAQDLSFFVDYRTRTQPMPSAPALASALAPELAKNAFLAGLTKGLGSRSTLKLSAAYAPPEFAFGGNVLGLVSEKLDKSVEVQATLLVNF